MNTAQIGLLKKIKNKTNPDKTTDDTSKDIIWSVTQFRILLFFLLL